MSGADGERSQQRLHPRVPAAWPGGAACTPRPHTGTIVRDETQPPRGELSPSRRGRLPRWPQAQSRTPLFPHMALTHARARGAFRLFFPDKELLSPRLCLGTRPPVQQAWRDGWARPCVTQHPLSCPEVAAPRHEAAPAPRSRCAVQPGGRGTAVRWQAAGSPSRAPRPAAGAAHALVRSRVRAGLGAAAEQLLRRLLQPGAAAGSSDASRAVRAACSLSHPSV